MLFPRKHLIGIRNGSVTVAFRRWRRPTVKEGGTLLTAVGELEIKSVKRAALSSISAADAKRAGYESRKALLDELARREGGAIYRIELGALRADPRIALRDEKPDAGELLTLRTKLERMDARAEGPPWTLRVLELLQRHEGVRAGDLCEHVDQETAPFKRNVRKLKALGLTESLGTGYRLSPRGAALLEYLRP
ncbi:MAG: hypothetical protein HKN20_13805 [Gemmatimonadetes bacterium]|nr:hypothetical protein [Gemmatimonadota bacterium]